MQITGLVYLSIIKSSCASIVKLQVRTHPCRIRRLSWSDSASAWQTWLLSTAGPIYLSSQLLLVLLVPGRRLEPPAGCPRRRGADDDPVFFSHDDLDESQRRHTRVASSCATTTCPGPLSTGSRRLGRARGRRRGEIPGDRSTYIHARHEAIASPTNNLHGQGAAGVCAAPARRAELAGRRGPFLFRFRGRASHARPRATRPPRPPDREPSRRARRVSGSPAVMALTGVRGADAVRALPVMMRSIWRASQLTARVEVSCARPPAYY